MGRTSGNLPLHHPEAHQEPIYKPTANERFGQPMLNARSELLSMLVGSIIYCQKTLQGRMISEDSMQDILRPPATPSISYRHQYGKKKVIEKLDYFLM